MNINHTATGREYEYQNLAQATNIRVLALEPAALDTTGTQISGSLFEIQNPRNVDYECLSYVWGSSSLDFQITIDGFPLYITESLYLALQRLRLQTEMRFLWIDQICINQRNIYERNSQVQQMGTIYSNADRDIVWLGEGSPAILRIFDWIRQDGHRMTDSPSPALIDGFRKTFQHNPVWQRIWIVQEIILSRYVVLCAGHKHLGLSDVKDMVLKYGRHPEVLKACRGITPMLKLRKDILESHLSPSLVELLSVFNDRKATDQRDRIYGLLGLATEGRSMRPNYAKSARRVFIEAATTIINESGNLELLCFQQNDDARRDVFMKRLPSWVPNFGTGWTVPEVLAHPGNHPLYSAGEPSELSSGKLHFLVRDEELITPGMSIGSLTTLSQPVCSLSENFEANLISALWTVLSKSFPFNKVLDFLEYLSPADEVAEFQLVAAMSCSLTRTVVEMMCLTLTKTMEGENLHIWSKPRERLRQSFIYWINSNAGLTSVFMDGATAVDTSLFLDAARNSFAVSQRFAYDAVNETMMLVCAEAKSGDETFVLDNVRVPLVLRRFQESAVGGTMTRERVGPAWIYGYMNGEAYGPGNIRCDIRIV